MNMMVLLNIDASVILVFYLIAHSPAILLLLIGAFLRKRKPKTAKVLFIISGIYFLIGTGICGMILQ